MKYFFTFSSMLFLFAAFTPFYSLADDFFATGEYQGKNIYVQNPLSEDKLNFCTQYVYVNDELVLRNPKTSAYEIKLSHFNIGDPVVIRIVHRGNCLPKIINPQVIRSKSKFQFLSLHANENEISWTSKGEYQGGVFHLEIFSHNAWSSTTTIYGKGNIEANQYSVAPEYHAGENKLRLKYVTESGNIFYSRVVEYFNEAEPVSFYPIRVADKIYLSRIANYEVLDPGGKLLAKGKSDIINCSGFKTGLYYLNIDNRTEKFFKK